LSEKSNNEVKTMNETVVALFDDFATAQRVVEDLVDAGYSRNDISLVANDAAGEYTQYVGAENVTAGQGAGFGAIIGTLTGLGVALIPGVGPVLAAGPLAAALFAGVGAAVGAATGGLVAGLIDLGVPEDDAEYYAEGVRRGGTLVIVHTISDATQRIEDVFNLHDPVNIEHRTDEYRKAGWSGYDPAAQPYTADQIAEERQRYHSASSDQYPPFDMYETDFRAHYDTFFANSGYTFDQYTAAYRYGYNLGMDDTYQGYDWVQLEPVARRQWEGGYSGTWEDFKEAIHEGWRKLTNRV
jgi:uncharacterized membrane protein